MLEVKRAIFTAPTEVVGAAQSLPSGMRADDKGMGGKVRLQLDVRTSHLRVEVTRPGKDVAVTMVPIHRVACWEPA